MQSWPVSSVHGVRPNGRSVFSMPAHTFSGLSDDDLGAILAFLRHFPPEPGLQPSFRPGGSVDWDSSSGNTGPKPN
jgi:hypothetical protein